MNIKIWDHLSKHQARDAVRLGLQSAVAAAVVYGLMQSMSIPEKFVGVLSAVLVIETSIGESIGNSTDRFLATIVGCLIGISCLYLMPSGYGVIGGLAISMFVMNGISAFKPTWRYGVVAAVALSINPAENPMTVAWDRSIAIGLGVVIGTLAAIVVWPDKSSSRAWRHIKLAQACIADYLEDAVDESISNKHDTDFDTYANRYSTHISAARSLTAQVRFSDNDKLKEALEATDNLNHAVTLIKTISGKTDNVHKDSKDVKDVIATVSETFCEAARKLANSESLKDVSFDKLDKEIKKLSTALDDAGSEDTVEQSAFVFAVTQTRNSLDNLNQI